jgi:hypothetical protein
VAKAVLALAPFGVGTPLVLARYLLPIVPFGLLWLAALVAAAGPRRGGVVAAVAIAGWVASGPLVREEFRRGSFAHHDAFVNFVGRPLRIGETAPVGLYRRLPRGPVLEAPWHASWSAGSVFPAYQLQHRRRVLVATGAQHLPRHPGLRFANSVPLAPQAIWTAGQSLVLTVCRARGGDSRRRGPGRLTPVRDDLLLQARRASRAACRLRPPTPHRSCSSGTSIAFAGAAARLFV